jgi:hypothetical protein
MAETRNPRLGQQHPAGWQSNNVERKQAHLELGEWVLRQWQRTLSKSGSDISFATEA